MNDFEKYLKDNKKQLELDSVNPNIWLSIENEVLKKKNRKGRFWLKIASAAAIFLLGFAAASLIFFNFQSDSNIEKVIAQNGWENYAQTINIKIQNLSKTKIPVDRKKDFEILLSQLEFLDAQYRDYLQYIEVNGYQEFIGEQILNYYKTKIDLLDKIQSEIEKINYYETKYKLENPTTTLDL